MSRADVCGISLLGRLGIIDIELLKLFLFSTNKVIQTLRHIDVLQQETYGYGNTHTYRQSIEAEYAHMRARSLNNEDKDHTVCVCVCVCVCVSKCV